MTTPREPGKCPSLLIHPLTSARCATSTCFWINPIANVRASTIAVRLSRRAVQPRNPSQGDNRMDDSPLTSILLRVRDQYSVAIRWSYITVILVFLIHLMTIGPFIELNRAKTKTEAEKQRLSDVGSKIAGLSRSFRKLEQTTVYELDKRLESLVAHLQSEFERLDFTVHDLRKKAETESALLPEEFQLWIPIDLREIHVAIAYAGMTLQFLRLLHNIPETQKELPEEVKNQLRDHLGSTEFRQSVESTLEQKRFKPFTHDLGRIQSSVPAAISTDVEQELPFQIRDPDLLTKIKSANTRGELLIAVKTFVEENIVKPRYLTLNEDWKDRILPAVQRQSKTLARSIETAKKGFPEEPELWEDVLAALTTTTSATNDLELKPPSKPPFWWSTVVGKETAALELSERVARGLREFEPDEKVVKQLLEPEALTSLRKEVTNLLNEQEKLARQFPVKLKLLEQQFKEQQERLASLAEPIGFIALELGSVIALFPLLLGLIFGALTAWTSLRLRELGWITHLVIQRTEDPLLWDWYCGQLFLPPRRKPAHLPAGTVWDFREYANSSLIRQSASLCVVFWLWIGIAAWRLHGVGGIEPGHLIAVTAIGAIVVGLAQFHRYMVLSSTLALNPADMARAKEMGQIDARPE